MTDKAYNKLKQNIKKLQKQDTKTFSQINKKLEKKVKDEKSTIQSLVKELPKEELKHIILDIVHTILIQIKAGADQTIKGVQDVEEKTTKGNTDDTIRQVTDLPTDLESKGTKETEKELESTSVVDDETLLTQEPEKDNEKEQETENNEDNATKTAVEETGQPETGINVMTTAMLTQKQRLLQQQHSYCTTEELEPRENSNKQE
eukprot:15330526-Ditylum_brightwellii.AAC.1